MQPISPKKIHLTLGSLVAARRNSAGLSQTELGKLTGMQQRNIARIEAGEQAIYTDQLLALAHALKLFPSELLPDPRMLDGPPEERKSLASTASLNEMALMTEITSAEGIASLRSSYLEHEPLQTLDITKSIAPESPRKRG